MWRFLSSRACFCLASRLAGGGIRSFNVNDCKARAIQTAVISSKLEKLILTQAGRGRCGIGNSIVQGLLWVIRQPVQDAALWAELSIPCHRLLPLPATVDAFHLGVKSRVSLQAGRKGRQKYKWIYLSSKTDILIPEFQDQYSDTRVPRPVFGYPSSKTRYSDTRVLRPVIWYQSSETGILIPQFWYQCSETRILIPEFWDQDQATHDFNLVPSDQIRWQAAVCMVHKTSCGPQTIRLGFRPDTRTGFWILSKVLNPNPNTSYSIPQWSCNSRHTPPQTCIQYVVGVIDLSDLRCRSGDRRHTGSGDGCRCICCTSGHLGGDLGEWGLWFCSRGLGGRLSFSLWCGSLGSRCGLGRGPCGHELLLGYGLHQSRRCLWRC